MTDLSSGLLSAYLLTLLLAQLAHYLLPQAVWPAPRSLRLHAMQAAIVTLPFLLALLLTHRPFLSGIITLAILAVFVVVNNAKYRALQEPLVFSDVYLYIQAIRHPRLFLPFLHIPLTLTAITTGLLLLYLAIRWEPALAISFHFVQYPLYASGLCFVFFSSIYLIHSTHIALSFNPAHDIRALGFFNSLIIYAQQALKHKTQAQLHARIQYHSPFSPSSPSSPLLNTPAKYPNTPNAPPPDLPDLFVIQSESFFDARRLTSAIKTDVLQHFDRIGGQASLQGQLRVPAWGANTLRPEFAFLSGIDNDLLEHYRFNPYQFLQNNDTPTLASYLKSRGYYCVAIHPNSATFFGRDQVFPRFGFEAFIDISEFAEDTTAGPYISDAAVQEKIKTLLEQRSDPRPLFLFVITMENHGPLHLENCTAADVSTLYHSNPPEQHHNLTVYLRHLKNADRMLQALTQTLTDHPQEAILCWYGDHVPSMPQVYAELGFTDGRSDYLLWHNRQPTPEPTPAREMPVAELGVAMLKRAGI